MHELVVPVWKLNKNNGLSSTANDDNHLAEPSPVQPEVLHVQDNEDGADGRHVNSNVIAQLHQEADNHANDKDFDLLNLELYFYVSLTAV